MHYNLFLIISTDKNEITIITYIFIPSVFNENRKFDIRQHSVAARSNR
jgi:hypothetical protein